MKLNISESIRRLRREADMTQEEVATALGVTYQAVSRWENGQSYPDIELLPSLAALFGVDMDRLFGIDDDNMEAQFDKYHREDDALENVEEKIDHVKCYIDAFPGEVYFKMRLLDLYSSMGLEYTDKRLPEMRRLCHYVVDHTEPDDWHRANALCNMICMEEDEKVEEWMLLLDGSTLDLALGRRYDYRDEVEKYNRHIQEHLVKSLFRCFSRDFCKRDRLTYKNARSRMEGQRVILRIIDVLRDVSTDEDAWIGSRMFAYVRLAGGCFGCGENEAGYDALERCLALCEIYSNIPEGTELPFNSPVLDEISQERGGGHSIFGHVIAPLTEYDGWEWFDCVRNEERYKQIVAKVTRIYEEMAAKEA